MGQRFSVALTCASLVLAGAGIDACSSAKTPTAASEIVITPAQFGTTLNVTVGDVIVIPRPVPVDEWQVDFGSPPLELLNPETRSHPGPDGWRFRAVAPGETEIGLVPITTGDAPPPRFAVGIRVSQ
jgi:hypothetical protein